jgi:hypothetical protein
MNPKAHFNPHGHTPILGKLLAAAAAAAHAQARRTRKRTAAAA